MKTVKYLLPICFVSMIMSSLLHAKVEDWTNFSEKTEIKTPDSFSQIVVVRPKEIPGKAINIYVDGEYITSLLPGAYIQEIMCPGKHRIQAAYTNVLNRYKEKKKGGKYNLFHKGKAHFYQIVLKNNKLILQSIPDNRAMKVLDHYSKKQSHTISRLDKRKCTQVSQNMGKEK